MRSAFAGLVGHRCRRGESTSTRVDGHVELRSSLVAWDFEPRAEKDRFDLFASMPQWEAKRLLFRMVAESTDRQDDDHI